MSSQRARRLGSHHWYWVAAIPATFLLWVATLAWLALAATWEAFAFDANAVRLSLIALGVPFVFLTAYFPLAVYRDATYVNHTSGKWAPQPMRQALAAAVGPVVLIVLGFLVAAFDLPPTWPVVAGFGVTVPVAAYYLYRRREHVGVPDVPW
ncbi:hypothetical protein BRC82_09285 [Halobacteriales archaeon QS_1_67_19]|nr:MAG: hypothetical protein BRC82_09285 [Halobacteriales archaeon QS_1_67_19]